MDVACIHSHYALNLVQRGSLVYNSGEAVFGLTSPRYGLMTAWVTGTRRAWVQFALVAGSLLVFTAAAIQRGPLLVLRGGLWCLCRLSQDSR